MSSRASYSLKAAVAARGLWFNLRRGRGAPLNPSRENARRRGQMARDAANRARRSAS